MTLKLEEAGATAQVTPTQLRYLTKILLSPVYQAANETPLQDMRLLSKQLQHDVFLKREDLQPIHSFKLRGAFQKLSLVKQTASKRVVCASAGNHAQGVAYSAKQLGLEAIVVMPVQTPEIKVVAVRNLGAEVILHGTDFDSANKYALHLSKDMGLPYIHPFDDEDVIAGQGTVAKELLTQSRNIDAVFIPVGGGGLLAGMAVYIKTVLPKVRVIGVEPSDSAGLTAALVANKPVTLNYVDGFADGVAVKQVGNKTFTLAQQFCDEVITVSSDEICAAMKDIFDDSRAVSEPAGAVALAGLKQYSRRQSSTQGLQLAAVLSGANLDFKNLRYVSERCSGGV